MKKTTAIFFVIMSSISFLQMSCKDEITPPVIEQPTDTTSHNFVVTRIDTLGDLFSSAYAVDIVNENDIWVVGEFYEKDTANNYNLKHNLAHWDGMKWKMIAVPIIGYNNTGPSTEALGGIKVFNDSSIFVVTKFDNSTARWNGTSWTSTYVEGAVVSSNLWARSMNEIYFVGPSGTWGDAAYYNGQTFVKMTTGITNPPLTDVWGDDNGVYATGHSIFTQDGTEHVLLYSNNTTSWQIIQKYTPTFENRGSMLSVYKANNHSRLWMLGGKNSGSVWDITSLSPFTAKEMFNINSQTLLFIPYLIRGNADNDLFIVGAVNGELFHFNGINWNAIETPLTGFSTQGFASKNNVCVVAGYLFGRAVVMMRKRK